MEFPDIGEHCSEKTCRQLDFLPVKCDACLLVFCSNHFSYLRHSCNSAHKKDIQVPICPICSVCVPTPLGVSPDTTVAKHIDQFCKSNKTRIFIHKCSGKGCKKKEMMPISCQSCQLNFCIIHRHPMDHDCIPNTARSNNGARSRQSNNQSILAINFKSILGINPKTVRPIFANAVTIPSTSHQSNNQASSSNQLQSTRPRMTEDEALAHALARSMGELDESDDSNSQQCCICIRKKSKSKKNKCFQRCIIS